MRPPAGAEKVRTLMRRLGNAARDYYHYDFHAQALAKIERGHELDLFDVGEMARRNLIQPGRLAELFDAIQPGLERYPAIDPPSFRLKVSRAIAEIRP